MVQFNKTNQTTLPLITHRFQTSPAEEAVEVREQ
jgi:hypothetical protein